VFLIEVCFSDTGKVNRILTGQRHHARDLRNSC
jgi:hypothetical protein